MHKYVALLRGINIGGRNKVDMKKLKAMFETAGYTNVLTYINSGNVIFETSTQLGSAVTLEAAKIEKLIEHDFGFKVRVVLRSAKNIKMLCEKIPNDWQDNKQQRTYVIFLWEDYCNKDSLNLIEVTKGVDDVSYLDGAIVWHYDKKFTNKSGMRNFLKSPLYKHMTARNINTVRKLGELLNEL